MGKENKKHYLNNTLYYSDDDIWKMLLRKDLIEEVMSKPLLTSRPDKESVVDALLPYVVKLVKK